MRRFIIRRLFQAVLMLLLLSFFLFLMIHALPGGPERVFFSAHQTAADRQHIIEEFGLDKPLPIQYLNWLNAALHFDMGRSYFTNQTVSSAVAERIPATLELFLVSLTFALIVAILLGVFSAVRQYSIGDYAVTILAYFGIAMPVFFFALVLQQVFGVYLQNTPFALPIFGRNDPTLADEGASQLELFIDAVQHLILPVLVLSLLFIAAWSRYLRASMLEVIKQDYIRTARAKGLSSRVVFFRHALRNALIPLITVVTLAFGGIFSGAFVTESIFSWPGLGTLFLSALNNRDYPIMLAGLLLASSGVIIFNLVADVLYAVVDPRIRYS